MTIKHTLKTSLQALRRNKSRSALTILGIVIGIAALILIRSVGQGAQDLILNQIRGLGSQTIIIEPGREPSGPSDFAEIFSDSLKEKEVSALKNPANVQGINDLAPNVMQVATISFENETTRTNVLGSTELFPKILETYPSEGDFFTEDDIRQNAAVALIGIDVKEDLFGASQAIGQKIKIKNLTFKVIGTFPAKGQVALFNVDKMVLVPYTTAQKYLLGINHFHSILVQAKDEKSVPFVVQSIKATLRELHNIDDPEKDDFHITTQADAAERAKTITNVLTILLISVAAVSLVVGGIGIMNIMLVSVTERTREIGLRKAIGATDDDILFQFLFEAVILTGMGGIIGISIGAFFSLLTSLVLSNFVGLDWSFSFPVSGAIVGFSVSAAVGLIFGLFPARQASKKSPIEALRYE